VTTPPSPGGPPEELPLPEEPELPPLDVLLPPEELPLLPDVLPPEEPPLPLDDDPEPLELDPLLEPLELPWPELPPLLLAEPPSSVPVLSVVPQCKAEAPRALARNAPKEKWKARSITLTSVGVDCRHTRTARPPGPSGIEKGAPPQRGS
jgi:hypothetical protein